MTLKKVRNKFIEVTVYYEFFNPKDEKTITVGFEAFSPKGDVDGTPRNGHHPYMRDFTVELNDKILNYHIAYVKDSFYTEKDKIKSIGIPSMEDYLDVDNVDFYYVYHFEAKFKKGLNIIKHTYNYDLSNSVMYFYDFDYILTAANRWANNQIDDFTLIIDMGEFETFYIDKLFFQNSNDWLINGIGKKEEIIGKSDSIFYQNDAMKFHIQKGNLIFQKRNFQINGNLFLYSIGFFHPDNVGSIPFSYYLEKYLGEPQNEFERKLFKNLPFARRGYVFKNKELQDYYSKVEWYIPNPNYEPIVEILTEHEKQWIEKWK